MTSPVAPGDVLAGKYRVERVLGVGGMGVVVAAMHLELGERVALKFLLPEAAKRPEMVARFIREAQAAVRIRSEHVARISDIGRLPDGVPYMVMEYLSGRDLADVITSTGPVPVATAVDWVLQACEALAEAHALGIVHRDLKPSNLYLATRADGSHLVKVLDFGIAKAGLPAGMSDVGLTMTNSVMGSPQYMSPEQVRSAKNVDARSDVWSLGVILYELVSGQPPFEGPTMTALLAAIIADRPRSLREVAPHVPPPFEVIVMRCLEKEADRRMSSVGALAHALGPFASASARVSIERIGNVLRGAGASANNAPADGDGGASGAGSAEAAPPGRTLGSWGQTQPNRASTSRAMVFAGAVLGVVLAGSAIWAIAGKSDHPSSPPSAAPPSPASTTIAPPPSSASASPSSAPAPPIVSPDDLPRADKARPSGTPTPRTARPGTAAPIAQPTPKEKKPDEASRTDF